MRRISKLFNFSLFWFFLAWCLPLDGFDMRIFKVGQANFVLLTHGGKALVVDCGVGTGYGGGILTKTKEGYWTEIGTALEDVVGLGIVITHNHADHLNNINTLRMAINSLNDLRRKAGRTDIAVGETCCGWKDPKTNVEGYVNHFFGNDGVEIECIRPDNFEQAFLSPEVVHENNLLLWLCYKGVSILLPGDANGSLFGHHLWHMGVDFREKLQMVSVFLASHHGSTANGEHVWLDAIFQNNVEKVPILFISSDPGRDNYLPGRWFNDKVYELLGPKRMYYKCLTSEAKAVCYRLAIDDEGNVAIFDGSERVQPVFFLRNK